MSTQPFFEYHLASSDPSKEDEDKDKKKGGSGEDEKKKKDGPVRTMMVGESPGDDLGYDPDSIPTEKIED